ncbi:MAG TPA: response regulator [Candidatus Sulfotelmatobacter sp.]|nr:response regulator [Candidatus Sulfotelmatobacter sp.]
MALKILAVDNEPAVTTSMRYIFSAPRYDVTGIEDPVEALARLDGDSARYDVIIVDQKMRELTGIELVSAIRQRGIAGKIIVLSAHLSTEIRETYKRMNVQVILDKPFDIEDLRSAVDRLAA